MKWLKSKYYPVDIHNRVIYNDPQSRERDCSLGSRKYHGEGTIGLKGSRLIEKAHVYDSFTVVEARTEPSSAYPLNYKKKEQKQMETLYKILSPEGDSLHGGKLRWDLPKLNTDGTYTPGNWHSVEGKIEACDNGLHLTTQPYRWYTWDCAVYEAEGRGDCDTHNGKVAYREARLLRPVQHPQWWLDAHRFVEAIPATRFMKPDAKPLKEWKLFTASTLDAAWDAARDAAWDAAWGAARGAARDAAWDAAWGATRDAALYVQTHFICRDLKLDPQHVQHAADRWRVWQKGYCLLCDVDGILYVYATNK